MTLTPTPSEDEVRALFLAHEHLAVEGRPERLAAAARLAHRRHRRSRTVTVVAALSAAAALVTLLAGTWAGKPDPAPQPAARVVPTDLRPDLRERALHVLDLYEAAAGQPSHQVISVAGPLLTQVGDWEPTFEDGKRALMARQIDPGRPLATSKPSPGVVSFPGGGMKDAPLLSAADAVDRAGRDRLPCEGCTPLAVTATRLTTTTLETSWGAATVPAWELSLKGTNVKLSYVALDPSSMIDLTPLEQPDNSHFVIQVRHAEVSPDGHTVTVTFWGGKPGCDAGYRALAVESEAAVVIVVVTQPVPVSRTVPGAGCGLAKAYDRTATVTLASTLGGRTLLDPMSGRPVRR